MRHPIQQRLTMRNPPLESARGTLHTKHALAAALAISLLGALPGLAHAAPS